jgi:hypothetical protein
MPTDMDEKKSETKVLSEAVLVAAASGLSYAVAYAYRSGFASYFDLPPLLLTPTLGAVLQAGAAVAAVLLVFLLIVNVLWMVLPQTKTAVSRKIFAFIITGLVFTLPFYWLFTYKWGWLILVGVWCYWGLFDFVFPLITQRRVAGYENKLLAQHKIDDAQTTLLNLIGKRYGDRGVGLVFAAFVLILFAHSVGYANAKEQEDFFVVGDAPGYVVAAIDDDMVILVAYDATTMTLKRAYTIRRLASEHVWQLEKKHIGKLVQPEPLNRKSKK